MPHQAPHAVLPLPNHDEGARQDFTVSLRRTVNRFASDSELAFKHRAAPAFLRSNNRLPRDRHDVRKVMKHLARDRSDQLRELRKGDRECGLKFLKKRQNRVGVEPPQPPTLNPKWNPRAEPPEVE